MRLLLLDNAFVSGLTVTVRSPDLWIPIVFRKSPTADWENGKYAATAVISPIPQASSNSVATRRDYLAELWIGSILEMAALSLLEPHGVSNRCNK